MVIKGAEYFRPFFCSIVNIVIMSTERIEQKIKRLKAELQIDCHSNETRQSILIDIKELEKRLENQVKEKR